MQWIRFKSETLNQEKKQGHKLVQKQLFKGSDHVDSDLISQHLGFDDSFLQNGKLGKGIYFAKNADYAKQHWARTESSQSNLQSIFICLVLTGVPLSEKEKPKKKAQDNSEVFMVQNNCQSYPLYRIVYEGSGKKTAV